MERFDQRSIVLNMEDQTSNENRLLKSKKIVVVHNDLQNLREICQRVPKEILSEFECDYGQLLGLLYVPLKTAVLSALACFWNSNLRCFELPQLDLVPTIEEYEDMLKLHIKKPGVYLYKGNLVSGSRVAEIIHLPSNQAKMKGSGLYKGWSKTLLEGHLANLAKQGEWRYFQKTLALLIYGLVLFPFTFGLVDQGAMDVFFRYDTQKVNPIPAILAETFLSMEICSPKNEGTIRCCPQLLYVWFVTHMYASNHLGHTPDPLKSFSKIPMKDQEPQKWKEEFSQFNADHFPWVCPWYNHGDIIFNCGNFPNVPLMGPRGCVAYTPAVALRQLKWTQVKPSDQVLGGLSFQYGRNGNNGPQNEVRIAWKDIKKKGEKELGKPRVTASQEYKDWRRNRGIPLLIPNKYSHEEGSSQLSNETLASLTAQMESMKAQMRLLEEKKEKAKVKVEILQKQCQIKDREIDRLNAEYDNAYSDCTKKARKRKGKEIALEEEMIKILEEKECLEMTNRVQEQRIKLLEENFSKQSVETDKWSTLAGEYFDAKTLAEQNEKRLIKKVEELTRERDKLAKQTEGSLTKQVEKLAHECDELKTKVCRFDEEKEELNEDWKLVVKHHQEQKNEWIKQYEDMVDRAHSHVTDLATYAFEANEEFSELGVQPPWKTYKFLKYCEDLTRNFV